MNTKTNIVVGVLVGLVVLFGGLYFFRPSSSPAAPQGGYGALAGPDFPFQYTSLGGLQTWSFSQVMTQAASTTCQWQTPPATTTLAAFSYRFTLASTSATIVEMGKSSGPNATTTLFGTTFNIAAGVQATVEASSTAGSAGDLMILAPSTWLAVKIGGGGTGSLPVGSCDFEVQVLP